MGGATQIDVAYEEHQQAAIARVAATFPDEDTLVGWLASPSHGAFVAEMEPFLLAPYRATVTKSMEMWVPPPHAVGPPRWKAAIATFVGLFPLLLALGPVTSALHFDRLGPIGALAGKIAISCILMTWLIMPSVVSLLGPWLEPDPKRGQSK